MVCNFEQPYRKNSFLGPMSVIKRELFLVWYNEKIPLRKVSAVEGYVFSKLLDKNLYEDYELKEVYIKLSNFISHLADRWKKSHRILRKFEETHKQWLDGSLILIDPTTKAGRPEKRFVDCSQKTKQMKITGMLQHATCDELMVATSSSLYKAGKRSESTVVSMMQSTAGIARKMKKCDSTDVLLPIQYTPDEALVLYIDGKFTKHSYKLMQAGAKVKNANIYPPYEAILAAKKRCYPSEIVVSESVAEISLQSMVDHTVSRIFESQPDAFHKTSLLCDEKITVIYKWGCDGSSGHSNYRQSLGDCENRLTDEYLFAVCLVPLQIKLGSTVIWKNLKPSSTRYCRPIKIICQKETTDLVRIEVENIEKQILNIIPTDIGKFKLYHDFHMTMIDGKVFNVVAESSSQICGICKASPKVMNDLKLLQTLQPRENLYRFGLSTLHAWIRCFECILHIAYRLPIKKWQVREADKDIVHQTKRKIQENLRIHMSLLADIPTATSGNTNSGNTARRFFQQPRLASELTGVNEKLICRLSTILRALACGYQIDTNIFRQYAFDTAKLFVDEYPWFYMPCSIHKILIHGADIIEVVPLPIGQMSEEALEARNKDCRNIREHHTRKNSRRNTMEDLIHALLCSSDPLITNLQKTNSIPKNKNIYLDKYVIELLCKENLDNICEDSDDNNSDGE